MAVPGGRFGAESDEIVGGSASEGAGAVVIGIAVSFRARIFKKLRVRAGFAGVGSRVGPTTAVHRIPKRLARAFTRHALVTCRHLQLRRTPCVQVHHTARGGTVSSSPALRRDCHGEVVPIHEADVVEVQPVCAVQRELGQTCWRGRPASGALDCGRATVSCYATKFAGCRVLRAESPPP